MNLHMSKVEFSIKDGIIYGAYPKGLLLDEEKAQEIVLERLNYLGERRLPALIDTTGVKAVTKEARDYLSKPEASIGIVAAALLSKSFFSKYISNFFIKLSIILLLKYLLFLRFYLSLLFLNLRKLSV